MSNYEFENILNDETALNEFEILLSLQFVTGYRFEETIITDSLIDLTEIRHKLQNFNNYQCVIMEQEVTDKKGQPLIGKFELEDKDEHIICSTPSINKLIEYIANNVEYIERIAKGGYFKKYRINYVLELKPKVLYKLGDFGYFCLINLDNKVNPHAKWLKHEPINKPFKVSSTNSWYAFEQKGELIGPDNQLNILHKLSSNKE